MDSATMRVSEVLSGGDFAYGHSSSTELGPEDSYYGAPWYGPMGGAWASVDDVARYARSLLGNGPLAARVAEQMVPRTPTGEWRGAQYGYGLFIDEGVSPTIVFHSGSVQGFLSEMDVVPDAGIATVILVNDDAHLPLDIVFSAIEAFVPLSY
jgi:CubicO group peptidase (beta-lactamase class C family)